MKTWQLKHIVLIILLFSPNYILAQVVVHNLGRGSTAEAAFIADGQIVGRITERESFAGLGDSETSSSAVSGNSSSYSYQKTSARNPWESLIVSGVLVVGFDHPEDVRHYFFSWSSIGGVISMEAAGTFRIQGDQTGDYSASLHIENWETHEEISVSLGLGEFSHSGQLVDPGYHQFNLSLDCLAAPYEVVSHESVVEFYFEILSDEVATENNSWGKVKALFR